MRFVFLASGGLIDHSRLETGMTVTDVDEVRASRISFGSLVGSVVIERDDVRVPMIGSLDERL